MEGSTSERGGRSEKCVITCALSGVAANRDQCPAIPYTPEDYAAEAKRAYESGASVVHIHARYPDGTNYATYSSRRKQVVFDFVFTNPFSDITYLLEQMNSANVKPECECFDTGHIGNVEPLIDMGLLSGPIQFSLITGSSVARRPTLARWLTWPSCCPQTIPGRSSSSVAA